MEKDKYKFHTEEELKHITKTTVNETNILLEEQRSRIESLERKSGCLTSWLILLLIFGIIGFFMFVYSLNNETILYQTYQSLNYKVSYQTLKDTLVGSIIIGIVNVIAVIGMLNWQKWGFVIYLICQAISLIINISIGFNGVWILIGLIVPVVTILLVQNKWNYFK